MGTEQSLKRIGIIGGGPSSLFVLKRVLESGRNDFEIIIFEKKALLGAGMPYSPEGANDEHVTNISDNETPKLVSTVGEWLQNAPAELLQRFSIDPNKFNEYKVLPRLLFGQYLSGQFELLLNLAKSKGILVIIHYETTVEDIIYNDNHSNVEIKTSNDSFTVDYAILCSGHNWPNRYEGKVKGYYDSPYPPSKLNYIVNDSIAIRGSSLTAIDAVRTLARNNGRFIRDASGVLKYELDPKNTSFKMTMHSRNGMLPAVRFHLEDSHLSNSSLLSKEDLQEHRRLNDGFLSLDFIFNNDFKIIFREKDPTFYEKIKNLTIEEFVEEMMELRERVDAFQLLRAEYKEAEKSIKRHESIYWKEMLAVLSFAMNHPAKYLSAEDMIRLQKILMPLISIVIAFIPQQSCEELIALHDAAVLDLISVGNDSTVEPQKHGGIVYTYSDENQESKSVRYNTFIDCIGQPHISYEDFPFQSLLKAKVVSPAKIKFKSLEEGKTAFLEGNNNVEKTNSDAYFLNVSGIAINDNFQILDQFGAYNERIYIMAVPYIGGYNPDYSGLDFCEATSLLIVNNILGDF